MKNIITIGGSSSKNSINKQFAEYAGSLVDGIKEINIDLNDYEMPIFSIDRENENGFPEKAKQLSDLFDTADGFIISLAEHNGAYSAAFKNIFDWLSRINGKVWRNKPMILLSTSPGARGGQSVLQIALNRFPFGGANIIDSMSLPSFFDNFSNGLVTDIQLRDNLTGIMKNYENILK